MLLFGVLNASFYGVLNANLSNLNATFGILNAKSVLRNFIKVKFYFWRFKRRRLLFMKLTPGHGQLW